MATTAPGVGAGRDSLLFPGILGKAGLYYFEATTGFPCITMTIPQIITAEYTLSVHRADQCPPGELPEVAFLGRSNVGKSTLINTLLGRKKLVRTSSKPGCTRALNFFLINQRWYFVDLPGFGYAAVPRDIKAAWGPLVLEYLAQRESLAAVVFLQDGRRVPASEELFLWEFLTEQGRRVIPVLTKADKLKRGERNRQLKLFAETLAPLGVNPGDPIWFSGLTREGKDQLWDRMLACLGEP
ncbi:MAG: ribosome biogenesis GTP-binding protein YihA/YsxC [Desulfobaccales bacterium]